MTEKANDRPDVWQDLVVDFLEMACFLAPEEQAQLVAELEKEKIAAEAIYAYPGFLIEGRMVIIAEEPDVDSFWLFNPKAGIIRKQKMKTAVPEF